MKKVSFCQFCVLPELWVGVLEQAPSTSILIFFSEFVIWKNWRIRVFKLHIRLQIIHQSKDLDLYDFFVEKIRIQIFFPGVFGFIIWFLCCGYSYYLTLNSQKFFLKIVFFSPLRVILPLHSCFSSFSKNIWRTNLQNWNLTSLFLVLVRPTPLPHFCKLFALLQKLVVLVHYFVLQQLLYHFLYCFCTGIATLEEMHTKHFLSIVSANLLKYFQFHQV